MIYNTFLLFLSFFFSSFHVSSSLPLRFYLLSFPLLSLRLLLSISQIQCPSNPATATTTIAKHHLLYQPIKQIRHLSQPLKTFLFLTSFSGFSFRVLNFFFFWVCMYVCGKRKRTYIPTCLCFNWAVTLNE